MKERSDYVREMTAIQQLVDLEARIPQQIFHAPVVSLWIIDFDEVFSGRFFDSLQRLTTAGGGTSVVFAVLDPDPDTYFYENFGTFPFLRFTPAHNGNDFIEALRADPGGSPADALLYNSEIVAIYPDSGSWMLYGDRNIELAVLAAFDEATAALIASHPPARLFSAEAAISELLPPVFRNSVPMELRTALLQNYGMAGER